MLHSVCKTDWDGRGRCLSLIDAKTFWTDWTTVFTYSAFFLTYTGSSCLTEVWPPRLSQYPSERLLRSRTRVRDIHACRIENGENGMRSEAKWWQKMLHKQYSWIYNYVQKPIAVTPSNPTLFETQSKASPHYCISANLHLRWHIRSRATRLSD